MPCHYHQVMSKYSVQINAQDQRGHTVATAVADQLLLERPGLANIQLFKGRLIKNNGQQRNIELHTCECEGETYLVKHYFERKLLKRLYKLLTGPEGQRAYRIACHLTAAGVPVAVPVASIIHRTGPVNHDSLFITQRIHGLDFKEVLHGSDWAQWSEPDKQSIWTQLATIWGRLLKSGYIHQDSHIGNFMLSNVSDVPSIILVDMDNIHYCPYTPLAVRLHSLARFLSSLGIHLERAQLPPLSSAEQTAFFKEFSINLGKPQDAVRLEEEVMRLAKKKMAKRERKRARREAR